MKKKIIIHEAPWAKAKTKYEAYMSGHQSAIDECNKQIIQLEEELKQQKNIVKDSRTFQITEMIKACSLMQESCARLVMAAEKQL